MEIADEATSSVYLGSISDGKRVAVKKLKNFSASVLVKTNEPFLKLQHKKFVHKLDT